MQFLMGLGYSIAATPPEFHGPLHPIGADWCSWDWLLKSGFFSQDSLILLLS